MIFFYTVKLECGTSQGNEIGLIYNLHNSVIYKFIFDTKHLFIDIYIKYEITDNYLPNLLHLELLKYVGGFQFYWRLPAKKK